MIKGITPKEKSIIDNIIKDYPYEFYAYGSRVKGNYTKASDLDILIKSDKEIPLNVLADLKLKFNESYLPYIVNFIDYNCIDEKFFNLIKEDLRPL